MVWEVFFCTQPFEWRFIAQRVYYYCTCTHVTRLVFPVSSDLIGACIFARGVDSESLLLLLLLLLLFCTLTVYWGYFGTLVATHVQGFSDWSTLCQTVSDWLMFFLVIPDWLLCIMCE
jgi:hypothetical protein